MREQTTGNLDVSKRSGRGVGVGGADRRIGEVIYRTKVALQASVSGRGCRLRDEWVDEILFRSLQAWPWTMKPAAANVVSCYTGIRDAMFVQGNE